MASRPALRRLARDLRLLDHSAYLYRDGLTAVVNWVMCWPMDAMGLGWVINMPAANWPLIQKSGGLQGIFAYLAIAPNSWGGRIFRHERVQYRRLYRRRCCRT